LTRVYLPGSRQNELALVVSQALSTGKLDVALVGLLELSRGLKRRENPLLSAEVALKLAQVAATTGYSRDRRIRKAVEAVASEGGACSPSLAVSADCCAILAKLYAQDPSSRSREQHTRRWYEAAIARYQELGDPYRLAAMYDALGFLHQISAGGDRRQCWERALACYKAAGDQFERDVDPGNWASMQFNIGEAYLNRLEGERRENLDRAIAHLASAAAVQRGLEHQDRFDHTIQRLEVAQQALALEALSHDPRSADLSAAVAALRRGDWQEGLRAYGAAIAKTEDMLASTYRLESRREIFSDFGTAHSAAAYCCLRLGRFEEAIQLIEAGRSRMMSEEMEAFDVQLDRLPEDLRKDLEAARDLLRMVRTTKFMAKEGLSDATAAAMPETISRNAWTAWNTVLDRVRAVAPDALPAPIGAPDLLRLVPEGGALVLPVFSVAGCCVLVAPHGRQTLDPADLLWIDTFNDNDLVQLIADWSAAQKADDRTRRRASIAAVGERLWEAFGRPVMGRLEALDLASGAPIQFLPQGGLGLLPLLAAAQGAEQQVRILDRFAVSYAPSAYLWSLLQRRVADRPDIADSLLAVVDPLGDLNYGRAEGDMIASLFPAERAKRLVGEAGSGTRLAEAAGEAKYLHLCCHGYYTTDGGNYAGILLASDPVTRSSEALMAAFERRPALKDFFLAGERWIVSRLNLTQCRLVTLSACDSGRVEVQSPDEFYGLPAAFLRAGAAAVVATLWRVDDVGGMLLAQRFYKGLVKDSQSPAQALRAAQLWLRAATNQELYEVYDGFRSRESQAPELEREMRRHALADPQARPYADPYYWAGYVVIGCS
jgi:CHAT domain-containing protein/tetratricopeptide (TPR) repeat protein